MSELREQILTETQIGKLKLLVIKLNKSLPEDMRITGYSTYTLVRIEELRTLALSKIKSLPKKDAGSNDITHMTVKELRALAEKKGIYIRSKALKDEIISALKEAGVGEGVIKPPIAPLKKDIDITHMTVKELRALADERGIYVRSNALKDEIIILLSKGVINGSVAPSIINPPPVAPVKNDSSIDIMTVKELKALAVERGIYISSKALKDEIIRIIKAGKMVPVIKPPSNGSGGNGGLPPIDNLSIEELKDLAKAMGFKLPPKISKNDLIEIIKGNLIPKRKSSDTCLTDKPISRFTTTPIQDYNSLKLVEFSASSVNKCLGDMGVHNKKSDGKGSYGSTYIDMYNGSPAIFKVVPLPGAMGVEGFKWECTITRRAAELGVGPDVLETSICYSGRTPKFGVMVLGKCGPLTKGYVFTKDELAEIYRLIVKLNDNGISHRDLGKRNIMRSGERLVLIDYGLALAFPGPVPDEYKIWDHTYLAYDTESYYEYLKTVMSKADIKKIDELEDDIKLESLTIKYFPVDMLRTLGLQYATMYINNSDTTAKAVVTDRMLKKRFIDEGLLSQ